MPEYTADFGGGRTITLTSDAPPTADQWNQIATQHFGTPSTQTSAKTQAPSLPFPTDAEGTITKDMADKIQKDPTAGSGARAFGWSAPGNTGALAGAMAGGTAGGTFGAEVGSLAGPAGTAIGGIAGGLIGGLGGMFSAQNFAQKAFEDYSKSTMSKDAWEAHINQMQEDMKQHPFEVMGGEAASSIVAGGMRPNVKNLGDAITTAKALAGNFKNFGSWILNPQNAEKAGKLINVGMGIGMGSINAANTDFSDKDLGTAVAIAKVALGTVLNDGVKMEHVVNKLPEEMGGLKSQLQDQIAQQKANTTVDTTPVVSTETPSELIQAPKIGREAPQDLNLPKNLSGAKPRYGYQDKLFQLSFDSDIDRAAYIVAQTNKNAHHDEYLDWLKSVTGASEADIIQHGKDIRSQIKGQAKDASPGMLKVGDMSDNILPEQKAPSQPAPTQGSQPEASGSPIQADQGKPLPLTPHLQTGLRQEVITPAQAQKAMQNLTEKPISSEEAVAASKQFSPDHLLNPDHPASEWLPEEIAAAKRHIKFTDMPEPQKQALIDKTQQAATIWHSRGIAFQDAVVDYTNPAEVEAAAKEHGVTDPAKIAEAKAKSASLAKDTSQEYELGLSPAAPKAQEALQDQAVANPEGVIKELHSVAGSRGDWNEAAAKQHLQSKYGLTDETAQKVSDAVGGDYKDQYRNGLLKKATNSLNEWKNTPREGAMVGQVKKSLKDIIDIHLQDQAAKNADPKSPQRLNDVNSYMALTRDNPNLPKPKSLEEWNILQDVLNKALKGRMAAGEKLARTEDIRELTMLQSLNNVRKVSLVSGFMTASKIAITHNVQTFLENFVKQPLARGVDMIRSMLGGKRVVANTFNPKALGGMGIGTYSESHSIYENMRAYEIARRTRAGQDITDADMKEINAQARHLREVAMSNTRQQMFDMTQGGKATNYAHQLPGWAKWMGSIVSHLHAGPGMVRFKIASNLEFDNQSKLVQEYFRHKEAITNQFRQEHEELMKAGDIDGAQKRIDQYNNDLVKLASRYPTHIDMDIVKAAGMKAAYQDETLWSKTIQNLKQNPLFGWLAKIEIPFAKVPGSIMGWLTDYSPIGGLKHLVFGSTNTGRSLYDATLGKTTGNKYNDQQFVEGLSRALVGTGVMAGAMWLRSMNVLSGSYSNSAKDIKANKYMCQSGLLESSVYPSVLARYYRDGFDKVQHVQNGDIAVPFSWLGPIGLSMSIGANLQQEMNKTAPAGKHNFQNLDGWAKATVAAQTTFKSTWTTIYNESFFQGIKNFADSISGSMEEGKGGYGTAGRAIQNTVTDLPSQMVPAVLKQLAQVTNPKRAAIDYDDWIKETFEKTRAAIPFAANGMPTQVGVNGQDLYKRVGYDDRAVAIGGNLLQALFSPVTTAVVKSDPVGLEALRLYGETGNAGAIPSKIPATMKVTYEDGRKETISLTAEQRAEAQRYVSTKYMTLAMEKMQDWGYFEQKKDNVPLNQQQVKELAALWSQSLKTYKVGKLGDTEKGSTAKANEIRDDAFGDFQQ